MNKELSIAANKKARENGELQRWCVVKYRDSLFMFTKILNGIKTDGKFLGYALWEDGSTSVEEHRFHCYVTDEEVKQFYETLLGPTPSHGDTEKGAGDE